MVRPPKFVPISGEIFIPLFIPDQGSVIKLSRNGSSWDLSTLTYAQFTASNATEIKQGAVRYQNINGTSDAELVISLDGKFENSIVITDIGSTTHEVNELNVQLEQWLQTTDAEVPNATGSNAAPSQSVNLNAAVLKGQASVSGGQANYQIPIDLPPGRAGIQPKVSLSYSSQSGNGIVGVGWSLNTGSAISRCGATHAQDGFTRAVTFNADTDRLCLNGQRLITSGSYGTSGTEYRTEMDSFVKVMQSGAINGASTHFTVYRPDGSTATYGANGNSRFNPEGLTTTLSWKVTQESYSDGMNTIDYRYFNPEAGEHLLESIYYTGTNSNLGDRQVKFIYEARLDKRNAYIQGGRLKTTQRLTSIETYFGSENWVSRYQLGFKQSQISKKTLLDSVQHCGQFNGESQCRQMTHFSWEDTPITITSEPLKLDGKHIFDGVVKAYELTPVADANGDGVLDFPTYYSDAEQRETGQHEYGYKDVCYYKAVTGKKTCSVADIDGDGRTDIVKPVNNNVAIRFSANNSDSFIETNISYDHRKLKNPDVIENMSDFNGDGLPDLLMRRARNGTIKWELFVHTGSSTHPYQTSIVITSTREDAEQTDMSLNAVGDIDGNGLPDLALFSNRSVFGAVPVKGLKQFMLNQSMGNNIVFESKDAPSFGFFENPGHIVTDFFFFNYMTDMNGDGLTDIIAWQQIEGGKIKLGYMLNTGNADFTSWQAFTGNVSLKQRSFVIKAFSEEPFDVTYPMHFDSFHSQDIDGDGINEILLPNKRLITGCASIVVPINYQWNTKTFCGDGLYQDFATSTQANFPTAPIDSRSLDESIYQYDAIKFTRNSDGSYGLTQEATQYKGSAYQATFTDAFGDGLVDMITAYGPRIVQGQHNRTWIDEPASSLWGANYGGYISRNYGSGTGITPSDYQPVDYLASVTDGLGNTSQWRYRPLSTGEASAGQTKMYNTDHDYVGDGYIHFGSSMYVVQSFEQSNGIGGVNETEYAYKGAMYNLQGRGFTGFREVIEKDVSRNKVTMSVFKQKFPFVSLLESQTVSVNGTTVATTTQSWADNPQHTITGVYHNINTRTITNSYGLSGSSERRSAVEQTIAPSAVDEFGNISKHTQTVTDYIDGGANSYQTVVDTVFTPDTDSWFLSKFNAVMTTNTVENRDWVNDPTVNADIAQVTTQTVESWDETHHKPTRIVYTASGSACSRSDVMVFNDYGLPLSSTVTGQSSTCSHLSARTTSFNYTKNGSSALDDGYLPYQVTNAKGHITTTEYNMGLGVPTKVTAPNSIVTQTQYDAIGRPVQVSQTGSPIRYIRYLVASNGNNRPAYAQLMTRTTSAGMPTKEVYLDSLGRFLLSVTQAFDGSRYQYLDKKYDSLGHLTHESLPFYDNDTPEYTVFSGFDAFDRPTTRSLPNGEGGLISTYEYTGLKTDITVDGRTLSRTYGMQGLLYETVDAAGGSNRFAYDGGGRPLVIEDANHNKIVASYNGFDHKTQVVDPNQGITRFGYNTLGELDRQTDANGVVQRYVFDTLGRITSQTTAGGNAPGTVSYTWDTLKQGLLTSETANGISRSYAYTDNLQLATSSVKVASSHGGDGVTRTVSHQYDSFYGRPKALTYPNGLTLEYRYNESGYLNQTRNAASGYIYRTVTDRDAAGHLTGSQMANALLEQTSSYNSEGTMASTQVSSSLGLLHNHYYERYDSFMNLTAERNTVTGLEKSYVYDNLNRLKQYSFSNGGFAIYDNSTPFAATVDYGYDAVGNLLKKSDYSVNSANAYEYGACNGPNRVCAITKPINNQRVTFSYDSRGNLLTGDGLTMTYNALDKPLTINGRGPSNNTRTAFVYGSDNMRALQTRTVSGKTTTTHYVGKLFESDNDGSWRAYIDDIAVLSYTPDKGNKLLFTLRDRLGSATTLVDEAGNIISQRYFDPFGRTATASAAGSLGDLLDTNRHRRGFTDHEHLNEQQLIHMNGRVYDYNMGRFMSVDPLIQSPTSTQSVNPYSYIMNNPLAGTDPTGYASDDVMTGSRLKGVDTGAHGATFGARVRMDNRQADSGANKSQTAQQADVKVDKIGGLGNNAQQRYGNDASFAKGYSSIKGDMSYAISWSGPGQAVDSIHSGIDAFEAGYEEYQKTGNLTSAAFIAGKAGVQSLAERKLKLGRMPDADITKGIDGKADFIVSPKGTTMPTNKDFNLVDSNKKGGDWFQIHNKHTDAKVGGSPHSHYPKQHGKNRTREIKRTDGGDLDRADNALRNGTMRERQNRGDKGG
ncbi:SpvB/TcaC N-terminal domain-containing protein [Shewanella sp. YLB-07]|uniref:SpvB/TcaC N-terminal domain-containing protein n=1 Tax=Shewanella sp. YLB-07 TaxID=2601268 RepID=UPI00188315B4|nr:RHS repeat-associated core domain-containing protein [Shewanella sp. YLB-07]